MWILPNTSSPLSSAIKTFSKAQLHLHSPVQWRAYLVNQIFLNRFTCSLYSLNWFRPMNIQVCTQLKKFHNLKLFFIVRKYVVFIKKIVKYLVPLCHCFGTCTLWFKVVYRAKYKYTYSIPKIRYNVINIQNNTQ